MVVKYVIPGHTLVAKHFVYSRRQVWAVRTRRGDEQWLAFQKVIRQLLDSSTSCHSQGSGQVIVRVSYQDLSRGSVPVLSVQIAVLLALLKVRGTCPVVAAWLMCPDHPG